MNRITGIVMSGIGSLLLLGSNVAQADRVVSYSYNDLGFVTRIDGPRTDVLDITTIDYDDYGNRTAITNAVGHVTQITAHDGAGRPLTLIDGNGLVTELSYDLRGRLLSIDRVGAVTHLGYDAVGQLISITRPDGSTSTFHYDTARRLIAIEDAEDNRIDYTLDAAGNRLNETVSDRSGQIVRSQSALYDELSRLIQSVGSAGQTTSISYDLNGNPLRTTDPLGQQNGSAFDALNRLVEQIDPLGGRSQYGYDAQDNLISVTDPNGNITCYDYDGIGNLIAQHSPDTGTTTFSHDEAGNILSKTDAAGQITTYNYDALNRITQISYVDGSSTLYQYDSALNGIGRLASITDSSGSTSWDYDLHGRITGKRQDIDGVILTTSYTYNSVGQLATMTYPSGLIVGYSYQNGEVSGLTINGQPWLSNITYQPFGGIQSWQWSNGTTHQRSYDLDGQLKTQSIANDNRSLDYDALGNITTINDLNTNASYGYDALSRLTMATDINQILNWDYDANGNRLSQIDNGIATTYSIDPLSNRLLESNATPYLYDTNGNLIDDGEHSFQYDARNRIVSVDEGSTAEYRYNALGQRVYKKWTTNSIAGDINGDGLITNADIQLVNGKDGQTIECDGPGKGRGKGQQVACIATQIGNKSDNGKGYSTTSTTALSGRQELLFAYQEHRLIGEYTTIGTAVQETVWLADTPVATIQNNNIYAIHTDHLGTPRVITDSSDFELWRWDSNPFGNTAANEDVDGDRINFTNNLRFPGQYYDVETGKHYNYFRDYDPSTGRYTTSDPIGLDGGLNTYGYVGGNPLKFIDPTGLSNAVVDRANGAITVTMDNGQTITYPAGNNTTNPSGDPNTLGSNGPAPAGTWPVQSPVNTSGDIRYGPYFWPIGAVDAQGNRADISRQRGIGLHGGRSSHQSRTQGCVRMDDADILDLYQRTINDPLTIIEIR